MRIINIRRNNRKKTFSVTTTKSVFSYPFAKLEPPPTKSNPLDSVWIDEDLGEEAFSNKLEDNESGTVHIDHVSYLA